MISIFLNHCHSVKKYNWDKVFWELIFIVCRDFMARDDAHFIFETAWKQFLQMGQEGVLISIAMGLAHSYVLSKRVNDTINFLEKICCGACPFGWLIQQPSKGIHDWRHFEELQRQKVATLYPALQQLANLYTEKSCDNGSILGILQSLQPQYEKLPTVFNQEDKNHPLNQLQNF